MCINEFEKYNDYEKEDLLKDYVDYLTKWECQHYDLFVTFDLNKHKKRKFLKAIVPVAFDSIDFKKLFRNSELIKEFHKGIKNSAYEFPIFYTMAIVTGLFDCYFDDTLTIKKLLWRWSKILLNY